ncbi:hypothetical protein QLX08_001549 [Tetragonisca angustula]|uniref:Uncharacterized protein n=1 Tax=Tetragonisca angustula TaxID=166442 RepID=A0AAW1AEE8_9HYME
MNIDKSKKDYAICSSKLDQRCFIPWSSPEDNFSFKHRYVPCSRSVPHKNKRFIKYRLSRSLNFDSNNSSSENSSLEEDKHLSRSARIMRALNFNSSSYYGKTKIKKSLNFNLTPSPKRFRHVKRGIQKSLSLNFSSPLSVSNKFINLDDNHSESMNSSLLFSSSDSIDENQNETPLQQNTKEHEMLHYSTPNTKNIRKSLSSASFTPLLRSRMKETIDNIVYITATPSSQSLKCIKGRSKYTNDIVNTSRNLFHEFHDKDDNGPCTPKNLICIIPESMSAIKKSHKKERSSRRSASYSTQFIDNKSVTFDKSRFLATQHRKYIDSFEDTKSDIDQCTDENSNSNELILNHSEDNISETGSLFDYTEEQKNILEESKEVSDSVVHEIDKFDVKIKLEENVDRLSKIDPSNIDANNSINNTRSVTPVPVKEELDSQKSVTPENHINILETIIKDSIKKSHKKIKGDNKKRLFSPKVSQDKLKTTEEQENIKCSQNFVQYENIEQNKVSTKVNNLDMSREERSCTPEKLNSSRLLLSQYSSVKKSHKKDKHNKIISGFLKRQEYFNKDMDLVTNSEYKALNNDMIKCKNSMENYSSDLDIATNIDDSTSLVASASLNSSLEKLSPSKRRKPQDMSSDSEKNILYDSELQELDTSKEEFQIFTPLKRKRSLIVSTAAKEYIHFYDSPIEHSKDVIPNISFSRCLTPVLNLSSSCKRAEKCNTIIKSDDNVNNETAEEIYDCGSNDVTGRLTPRNMSTTELYSNLDSIKKSHKKNKRGSSSWKSIGLIEGNHSVDGKCETSVENVLNETNDLLELSNNCAVIDDEINKSICNKSIEKLANPVTDNQSCASISTENISPFATPPNCLKTKSYIRLLQETSIKRSHKKIRNKKKEELIIDTDELSDDGSIFGDEEKLSFAEDKSTHD